MLTGGTGRDRVPPPFFVVSSPPLAVSSPDLPRTMFLYHTRNYFIGISLLGRPPLQIIIGCKAITILNSRGVQRTILGEVHNADGEGARLGEDNCDGCASCSGVSYRRDKHHYARQARGRALIEVLKYVKDGTTIEIAARVSVKEDVRVIRSVRLVGTPQGRLEMGGGRLIVSWRTSLVFIYSMYIEVFRDSTNRCGHARRTSETQTRWKLYF